MSIGFGAQINCAQDSRGELYLIRKVFVDRIAGSNQSARFRSALQRRIAAQGFVITTQEENADAIWEGSLLVYKEKKHGDWFLNAKAEVRLRSRRGNQLWYADQLLGENLSFGRRDLVEELADHIATGFHNAWEGSLQVSRDGRVEHVLLYWERSDKQLTLGSERTQSDITEEELSTLKALGLHGNLKVAHTGIEGSGRSNIRVIIVMHQPLYDGPLEFSLTKQSSMFIIQMEDRWITDPSPIPFSKSKLRILPIASDQTGFTLDRENAGIQFQFDFKWPRE